MMSFSNKRKPNNWFFHLLLWLCQLDGELKYWMLRLLCLRMCYIIAFCPEKWEVVMATFSLASYCSCSVLSSAVEKLKNQWDSTQHSVEVRQQQLKHMLADSLQWHEQRQEMEHLMEQCEIRLRVLLQAPKEMLAKQIAESKVWSLMLNFFPIPDSWVCLMLLHSIDEWMCNLVVVLFSGPFWAWYFNCLCFSMYQTTQESHFGK